MLIVAAPPSGGKPCPPALSTYVHPDDAWLKITPNPESVKVKSAADVPSGAAIEKSNDPREFANAPDPSVMFAVPEIMVGAAVPAADATSVSPSLKWKTKLTTRLLPPPTPIIVTDGPPKGVRVPGPLTENPSELPVPFPAKESEIGMAV